MATPPQTRMPALAALRAFEAAARLGSVRRAAEELHVTPAAVTQQIRALEDRIGVRLVDRSSRAVELTAAGQDLLPEIRGIVESVDRLRNLADRHAREISGHLIIGSVGAEAAMPYTRALLDGLHARHPKVTVEIRLLNFVEHVRALAQGDVDAALVRPPVPPGIQLHHLATEPRVAVICSDDPLAAGSSVTLAGLAGRTVVDVPPEIPRVWWDFWAVDPRPDGSPVRYGPVVNDVEALLHAVATGKAMSFLPSAARDLFPRPGVRYLDVTDLSPCTSALAWLPKNRNRPTIAALRQVAQTIA